MIMYRYLFSVGNFEYSEDYVFLHETKYTEEEFRTLCHQVIKEAVESKLVKTEIFAFEEDNSIVKISSNSSEVEYPFTVYSTDEYKMFTEYWEEFKALMLERGFTLESLPLQASMCINDYTYINERLDQTVSRILDNREELENIPRIEWIKLDSIQQYVSENATSREHAIRLLKEKLSS